MSKPYEENNKKGIEIGNKDVYIYRQGHGGPFKELTFKLRPKG